MGPCTTPFPGPHAPTGPRAGRRGGERADGEGDKYHYEDDLPMNHNRNQEYISLGLICFESKDCLQLSTIGLDFAHLLIEHEICIKQY